jgi:hypothetical protein
MFDTIGMTGRESGLAICTATSRLARRIPASWITPFSKLDLKTKNPAGFVGEQGSRKSMIS